MKGPSIVKAGGSDSQRYHLNLCLIEDGTGIFIFTSFSDTSNCEIKTVFAIYYVFALHYFHVTIMKDIIQFCKYITEKTSRSI